MQEGTQRDRKKAELKVKLKEQEILQYELSSLKPKAKVYRQQQNSNIFFQSGMEQEMQRAKRNMERLQKEYSELEATAANDEEEEGEGDVDASSTS